jgi:hypothetical protein
MKCYLDDTGRIVVKDPTLLYPLASEFGSHMLQMYVREQGKLPRIIERHGSQFITAEWIGQTIPIDDLLGRWTGER